MEKKEILDAVFRSMPYGIVAADNDSRVLLCNELGRAYLRLPESPGISLLGQVEHIPELYSRLREAQKSGKKPAFDLLAIPADGFFLTIRCRPTPQGFALSIIDVTRSKQTERHMLHTMLEAQEEQRRKLSTEIHDGIGPLISTIKLNLDALKLELGRQPSPQALKMMESMSELLQGMSAEIRNISHNLMPNVLVDFGLVAALENLCHRLNSSGKIQANFFHSGMRERLDLKIALGLYRISQELINNTLKYARANTINIQLVKHPSTVVLAVEDDGIGFDPGLPEEPSGKGIGLQNIQTRAKSMGGAFLLEAQPGKGVLATVEVPLKN
ncbi:MAG: hypothetical protein KDC66_19870 [Phaeodactylibacter sp.]|nr:hypothetical protein [Phaeodactylibacter sp.]MCB9274288.1 hypothetical protein [Lewinellaceae bacterium]